MVLFEMVAVTIIIGMAYGYLKPGREDRTAMLKKGILFGVVLALILIVLAGLLTRGELLLAGSMIGILVFADIIVLAILFIVGTFIGDWLEEKGKAA